MPTLNSKRLQVIQRPLPFDDRMPRPLALAAAIQLHRAADARLRHLRKLTKLEQLSVGGPQVTDQQLLRKFKSNFRTAKSQSNGICPTNRRSGSNSSNSLLKRGQARRNREELAEKTAVGSEPVLFLNGLSRTTRGRLRRFRGSTTRSGIPNACQECRPRCRRGLCRSRCECS